MGELTQKWFAEIDMLNSFMQNPTKKRLQFKEFLVKEGIASPACITHKPIKDIKEYFKKKYPKTKDMPFHQFHSKKLHG